MAAFAAVGAEAHSRGKLLAGCMHGAEGTEEEGGSLAVVDLATGTLVSKARLLMRMTAAPESALLTWGRMHAGVARRGQTHRERSRDARMHACC